jgi:hypothetical protein
VDIVDRWKLKVIGVSCIAAVALLLVIPPTRSIGQTPPAISNAELAQHLDRTAAEGVAWSGRPIAGLSEVSTFALPEHQVVLTEPDPRSTPLAVAYRTGPDGPTGSVGFQSPLLKHFSDPGNLNGATPGRSGPHEVHVGARLSLRFK